MYKNVYELWKEEKTVCKPLGLSVMYHENKDDWAVIYKDDRQDVVTVKNSKGSTLVYFRTAEETDVGDGDVILLKSKEGKVQISPYESIFKDIRMKMSVSLMTVVDSYTRQDKRVMERKGKEICL